VKNPPFKHAKNLLCRLALPVAATTKILKDVRVSEKKRKRASLGWRAPALSLRWWTRSFNRCAGAER